jgi:hypothetical protein
MKQYGRVISHETYIMFMNKYNLCYKNKTFKEMALEIYNYEIEHKPDIIIGLYINGLY